ncbi:hypothetical protein Q5425_35360 [Amycolatopsis sp. A133]|nr:hypothetical protein [Amycolatopsis sp. A133]MDQ7809036.1 hypothetical protein [Amycolatopsis sp. A133]
MTLQPSCFLAWRRHDQAGFHDGRRVELVESDQQTAPICPVIAVHASDSRVSSSARDARSRPARIFPPITETVLGLPAVKKDIGSYSVNTTLTNPRGVLVTEVWMPVIASASSAR